MGRLRIILDKLRNTFLNWVGVVPTLLYAYCTQVVTFISNIVSVRKW